MSRTSMSIQGILAAGLLAVAGCSDGPTQPSAEQSDALLAFVGAPFVAGGPGGETFEQPCQAGGRMIMEGTTSVVHEEGMLVVSWDSELRHEQCGRLVQDDVAVANGAMSLTGEARFAEPEGGVAEALGLDATQEGSLTVTWRGQAFSCTYDLHQTYDPARQEYRTTGEACGRRVDRVIQVPGM